MDIDGLTRPLPPSDLSTETGLDSSYTAPTATRVARDEVEAVLSLIEFSIGASTGLAGDIFDWMARVSSGYTYPKLEYEHTDISPQDVLDLFLLETTLDNQSPASVHTAAGSQLREQELHNMVV